MYLVSISQDTKDYYKNSITFVLGSCMRFITDKTRKISSPFDLLWTRVLLGRQQIDTSKGLIVACITKHIVRTIPRVEVSPEPGLEALRA